MAYRWVWPEGVVLFSNTIVNISSEYGTSPIYYYFLIVIPKTLHIWLLPALLGVFSCKHPLYSIQDSSCSLTPGPSRLTSRNS